MFLWSFLVGLISGFVPLFFLLRLCKGKVLFISNVYLKGAVFGFLLWGLINLFFYFDARYDIFGFLKGEEGFTTMLLFASSIQGFITAGLLAAWVTRKLEKKEGLK